MLNEIAVQEFALRLRQLRLGKNISQEKLGLETGFHRTYIGMLERGERNISLINLAVFAKYFQLTLSELLDFSEISEDQSYKKYNLKSEE